LEAIYLCFVDNVVERIKVVKFIIDKGSGNGGGTFEVYKWADSAQVTDVVKQWKECTIRTPPY
jgi:hypothetical protein